MIVLSFLLVQYGVEGDSNVLNYGTLPWERVANKRGVRCHTYYNLRVELTRNCALASFVRVSNFVDLLPNQQSMPQRPFPPSILGRN